MPLNVDIKGVRADMSELQHFQSTGDDLRDEWMLETRQGRGENALALAAGVSTCF